LLGYKLLNLTYYFGFLLIGIYRLLLIKSSI